MSFFSNSIIQLQGLRHRDDGLPSEDLETPIVAAHSLDAATAEIPKSDSESDWDESSEDSEDEDMQNRANFIAQLDATAPPQPFSGDLVGGSDLQMDEHISRIENVSFTQQLIHELNKATLDDDKLDPDVINRLRNPITKPVDISDPDIRLSLDLFIACERASEAIYKAICEAFMRRCPDINILSHYRVKKLVAEISGVVSVLDDMCINSCTAFVGPFANATECPECQEPRYKVQKSGKEVPRQHACTIPLGPQLQALRRSPQSAAALTYRDRKTKEILETFRTMPLADCIYEDIFSGSDLRKLALNPAVALSADDITISFSLDGAQLYQNKKSDTWIAIWIINDYDPKTRYKRKHEKITIRISAHSN